MNNIRYINALKNALAIKEDERKDIERCRKSASDYPDNVKFQTFIALYVFRLSFFFPLSLLSNKRTKLLMLNY